MSLYKKLTLKKTVFMSVSVMFACIKDLCGMKEKSNSVQDIESINENKALKLYLGFWAEISYK